MKKLSNIESSENIVPQLVIYRKMIWEEKSFYGVIASGLFFHFCGRIMSDYPELRKIQVNFWGMSVLFFIIVFWGSFIVSICLANKKNKLLKYGEIIWAQIDKDETSFGLHSVKVNCYYFNKEMRRTYEFVGEYEKQNIGLFSIYKDKFEQEEKIAVIIDKNNYDNYMVLVKELIYSYKTGLDKPLVFSPQIRVIYKE